MEEKKRVENRADSWRHMEIKGRGCDVMMRPPAAAPTAEADAPRVSPLFLLLLLLL
jgi:hypothetical protein